MNKFTTVLIAGLVVLLGLMGSAVRAGEPAAPAGMPALAQVGTGFIYDGFLLISGNPANGTFDFEFRLFDVATAGTQIGVTITKNDIVVRDGHYRLDLNFGTGRFAGTGYWLDVRYRLGSSTGVYTLTGPRQSILTVPYALGLVPGAQMVGNVAAPGRAIVRGDNTGTGVGLWGQATSNAGVYGQSSTGDGVWGLSTSGRAGVFGESRRADGSGVYGYANAAGAAGVYGKNPSGPGVWGFSDNNIAVYGESTNYHGLHGVGHNVNHGAVVGVHDRGGIAIYGESTAPGNANGKTGAGVVGKSRDWIGVYGESTFAFGLMGKSTTNSGVIGESRDGYGVYAKSTNSYAGFFDGKMATKVLEIRGGSDLAERFEVQGDSVAAPGTLMVIDEANPGKLKVSDQPYDTKVAGIVSGAGGVNTGLTLHQAGVTEGDHIVAMTGRVYVKADAGSGAIKPGDLLTTSANPGHAMRASDAERRGGAIVGKAMTGLGSGTGLVLVLVNLQ